MKQIDELTELIRSLSKSEKRYFRLWSTMHKGSKNYLSLFDAIEKQRDTDPASWRKSISNKMLLKHLPSYKKYLYNEIISCLIGYHRDYSPAFSIKMLLMEAELLMEKSMPRQCYKALQKARKMAESDDWFLYLLEILKWEKALLVSDIGPGILGKKIADIVKEEAYYLERLQNLYVYKDLFSKMVKTYRDIIEARTPEDLNKFNTVMRHSLLKSERNALSKTERMYYYKIHTMYHMSGTGDLEQTFTYASKLLIENESLGNEGLASNIATYVSTLHLFISACNKLKKYDESAMTLEKMKHIQENLPFRESQLIDASLFVELHAFSLEVALGRGNYSSVPELINQTKKGLESFKEAIDNMEKMRLLFILSKAHFITDKPSEALLWLNEVLNEKFFRLRIDLFCISKILNLLIHYELGNIDLLTYLIPNTKRFLQKENRLFLFEKTMLTCMSKLSRIPSKQETTSILKKLVSDLEKLAEDPFEKKVFLHFDFRLWAEAKLLGTSLATMVDRD